jgi:hypothetical protein
MDDTDRSKAVKEPGGREEGGREQLLEGGGEGGTAGATHGGRRAEKEGDGVHVSHCILTHTRSSSAGSDLRVYLYPVGQARHTRCVSLCVECVIASGL